MAAGKIGFQSSGCCGIINTTTALPLQRSMCMNKKQFAPHSRRVFRLWQAILYWAWASAFLLAGRGYSWFWAFLMSATIYAGSMQYAALDLISGGASLIACALMTLMINARHFFYGLSMLDKYQDAGKKKPYLIFALTDETYSLVLHPRTGGR